MLVAAAAGGVSGAGSGWFSCGVVRGGGRSFSIFQGFLLVLAGLLFWRGGFALGYHSMRFGQFSDDYCFPN